MEDKELTFSELDKKKKFEHIWEYYKIHIIGGILIFIALLTFIFKGPAPQLYCGIGIYGPHVSIDSISLMEENLEVGANVPKDYEIDIVNFFMTNGDDQLQDVDMVNKFQTYIMTLQLHLLIGSEAGVQEFLGADYIAPLSQYLSDEEIQQLADKNKIYYGKGTEDTEEIPYGIRIDDSSLLKNNNIMQEEPMYICFVPIQDNTENTLKVLKGFLE